MSFVFVSIILFSVTAVLIAPFIRIYTAGVEDANYIQPLFGVLMALTALSYCLRLPYHSMVIAAGHFMQTSAAAYGEAIINIGLSVILVSRYGLIGVAAGTLAATWFRFLYYVVYLSRNIFYRKVTLFLKRLAINVVAVVGNYLLGRMVISFFATDNYLSWAICGATLVAAMGALTLTIYFCFFRSDSIKFIRKLLK